MKPKFCVISAALSNTSVSAARSDVTVPSVVSSVTRQPLTDTGLPGHHR